MNRREVISSLLLTVTSPSALAQSTPRLRRLAVASVSAPLDQISENGTPTYSAFFRELRKLGYLEGSNLAISRHSGNGRSEHYEELAREVVETAPDIIHANSARFVRYLQQATTTIPIVALVSDPVRFGFAKSLARPGGNITGFSADTGLELLGKYLDVLVEAVPGLKSVGFLAPRAVWGLPYGRALQEAGRHHQIELIGPPLDGVIAPPEYKRVIDAMVAAKAGGFVIADVPENITNQAIIVEIINQTRLPAVYHNPVYARIGGLIAYGVDTSDFGARSAVYVDLILKGASPAEMPFQQPTKLTLAVNLRTAKQIGIDFPQSLLARADEVIE